MGSSKEACGGLFEIYGEEAAESLIAMIDSNINCPQTSSMGRLFDAVSNIIGITDKVTYEGQAAIELEAVSDIEIQEAYSYKIIKQDMYIIEPYEMIKEVIKDKNNGVSSKIMASKFQNTIVNLSVSMCTYLRTDTGINEVALSGGVFQNPYLLKKISQNLEKKGFGVYTHTHLPSNDSGVAIGQIIIANSIMGNDKTKGDDEDCPVSYSSDVRKE